MTLPTNQLLHEHCQRLKESDVRGSNRKAFCPWEDFGLKPHKFSIMTPLNGGREYYNPENLNRLLQETLEALEVRRGLNAYVKRIKIHAIREWLKQLDGEELPPDVGEGYKDWVAYLRRDKKE